MHLNKDSKRMYYHVSLKDMGKAIHFTPRIPDTSMPGEDITIPRICVAPSIYGCVKAIYLPQICTNGTKSRLDSDECVPLYVYAAYVDDKDVVYPSYNLVPDADYTGEVWIMKNCTFEFYRQFKIHKQFDLPFSAYSRYAVSPMDEDEVVDVITSTILYGDNPENFSYIDLNPSRVALALEYRNATQKDEKLANAEKIFMESINKEKSSK